MPTKTLPLTLVFIHYHSEASTFALLQRLAGLVEEILLIDNSQSFSDYLAKQAASTPAHCQIVSNPLNLGFAHAANQALALAHQPFVLFLNADVDLSAEQLQHFFAAFQSKKLLAACPTLVDAAGRVDPNYQQPVPNFWYLLLRFSPLRFLLPLWPSRQLTLAGACLLVERQALLKLAGFDERFFIWLEDSDLSRRLYQAQLPVAILTEITVFHQGGETFHQQPTAWQRNVFFQSLSLYAQKWFPAWQAKIWHWYARRFSADTSYLPDPALQASYALSFSSPQTARSWCQLQAQHWRGQTEYLLQLPQRDWQLLRDFPFVVQIVEQVSKDILLARRRGPIFWRLPLLAASPTLSIILPNLNGLALLEKNLAQLVALGWPVIVVDNASSDRSVRWIQTHLPQVKVKVLDKNYGFTRACNEGARLAQTDLLLFLNTDCVISKKAIQTLIAYLAQQHLAATQPVVLQKDGQKIENIGFSIDLRRGRAKVFQQANLSAFAQPLDFAQHRAVGLSGTALLVNRTVFEQLGGFDESFHSYLEDVDFSLRLARAQYPFQPCLAASCVHDHMATSAKMPHYKEWRDLENWLRLIVKNYPTWYLFRHIGSLALERLRNVNGVIKSYWNVFFK